MLPFDLDLAWTIAFQALGDWLVSPMRFFSFLGTEEFYILMMPMLYWCIDASLGIRVGLIMLVSSGLNDIFKITFAGPRPYWINNEVNSLWAETTFGLPSGHAQQSVAIWGSIAAYLRRGWAWTIAVFLMIMIGLSRVFLGSHFVQDVVAGWLIGALLLWLSLCYWDQVVAWMSKQSFGMQIFWAFLAAVGIVLLGGTVVYLRRELILPETWLLNAARAGDEPLAPLSMSGILTSAGTLFGLLVGMAWMASRGGWQATGPLWKRLARYVIGLVGVLVIWYGLGLIFPRGELLVPFFLRFVRYALLGLWVSALAPLFFMKLKLS